MLVPESIKQLIKKKLLRAFSFRIVSLEEAFPDIERLYLISSETIDTSEAESMLFVENAKDIQSGVYSTPQGYVISLKGVLYCPEYNIILTSKREVVADSFIPHSPLESFNFKITWLYRNKIETIPGYCLIFDQLMQNNFYHRLIDNIPRFYLACQHKFVCEGTEEIRLIHTTDLEQDPFLMRLKPQNVILKKLSLGKLYYIENLIFSSFVTRHYCGYIPSLLRQKIYSQFLPKRPREPKNLIYISRKKAPQGRRINNEGELLDKITKLGFRGYILEDLPVPEQIELFYDAKVVIAPHGAGLTNLLFSEKVKVLELFQMKYITPNYYYLSKSMGHDYHYWCSSLNIQDPWANFNVNTDEVMKILENIGL